MDGNQVVRPCFKPHSASREFDTAPGLNHISNPPFSLLAFFEVGFHRRLGVDTKQELILTSIIYPDNFVRPQACLINHGHSGF